MKPTAILIAGPTASGKSEMAILLAATHGGVVVNADSMQVYRQLNVITARPNPSQLERCEHALYGHRDGHEGYSVAAWLGEVAVLLEELKHREMVPVFVGGTGLYFKSLLEGLASVPEPDGEIRDKWRKFAKTDGEHLHDELARRDPVAAGRLQKGDHQRIMRALEVIETTGKSIVEWQNEDGDAPLLGGKNIEKIMLMPERSQLHQRINERFDVMAEQGGLEEVRALLDMGIDPALPIMKAIGVPQFAQHLAGEITLAEAIEKAKAATRQYAKRQSTWFNNQFSDDWAWLQ